MAGQVISKPVTNKQVWEKFVATRSEANFLQSWNWGQFHANLGKTIQRTGFFKGPTLKGVMLSVVETAKRGTYLTVPGGPLINWSSHEIITAFKNEIIRISQQESCSFVRVRPQILETQANSELFASLGFKKAPIYLHAELTHQLDLSQSEAELLKNMRKSTRYGINKAEKIGIKISTTSKSSEIGDFYNLQLRTAKRHGFVPFSKHFLVEQFKTFAADNQALLFTASINNKILNQAIIIFYSQEADYHYAASSDESRKFPGAYALQWAAIKEAKQRGMKRYNLWGVAPENQTRHRFYGVSVFKRGFRGKDVEYLHARDLVINPFKYSFSFVVELFRKLRRRV